MWEGGETARPALQEVILLLPSLQEAVFSIFVVKKLKD